MPFHETSKMHERQRLADMVLRGSESLAGAARLFGVTRKAARLWVARAREVVGDVTRLYKRSCRPKRVRAPVPKELEEAVLAFKAARPVWGAKKIVASLWPEGDAPVSVRSVDRVLERHGLVMKRGRAAEPVRFARPSCNEMWQVDFKGMGEGAAYSPLSVFDDRSRFCVALRPVSDHRMETVWEVLWEVAFAEYGLPSSILFDNEECFGRLRRVGPSRLEARLLLLGIVPKHGRPAHPQTQGKVERFHRTVNAELGPELRQPSLSAALSVLERYRQDYNWNRPHEELGMKRPGQVYVASERRRPQKLPAHELAEGAISRKVDAAGKFRFRGHHYHIGAGLRGESVEIRDDADGPSAYFAGIRLTALSRIEVP